MNRISSRRELIYDLRLALGAPFIRIELTDEHIGRCIDTALKEFWKHHRDGSNEAFYFYTVTEENVTDGFIEIPEVVDTVMAIIPQGVGSQGTLGNPEWHMIRDAYKGMGGFNSGSTNVGTYGSGNHVDRSGFSGLSISDFVIARQYIQLVRDYMGDLRKMFTYKRYERKLVPKFPMRVGDVMCIQVFENTDPDENPDAAKAYDEEWMKSFALAQCKITWGNILRKYSGVALPGGATIDGNILVQEGKEEERQLLEDIRNESVADFIGYG